MLANRQISGSLLTSKSRRVQMHLRDMDRLADSDMQW